MTPTPTKEGLLLQQAIEQVKQTAFIPGYKATDEEALGILVSRHLQWNGEAIFEVAQGAFEDANYHSFNVKFQAAWEADKAVA